MATWNLVKGGAEKVLLPERETQCRLHSIKEVIAPDFVNGGERQKLVFAFVPLESELAEMGIELGDGQEVSIETWVNPIISDRSNLNKLMEKMAEVGEYVDEVKKNPATFQSFCESMIGREFLIHHKAGKKMNYPVSISRIPGRNKGKEFKADAKNEETKTGFENYPDAEPKIDFDTDDIPF